MTGVRRARADRAESRSRTAWLVLGVILLGGVALRASYLSELRRAPDFATPLADAAFHDYWARGLATGDWTPPAGEEDPRIREVPFLRPPGYPYFLALAYALAGDGPVAVRVVQIALGLLNVFLAFLLGRALFGRVVGLIVAVLCASSWVLVYFEGELQAPVLVQTLALGSVLLLHRWSSRRSLAWAVAAGLSAGLLALVRANALLFLPAAGAWMARLVRREGGPAGPWRPVAGFALGAAVAILPVSVRNVVAAGDFFLVSCNGAVNFYIGNNETSDGVTARIPNLENLTGMKGWSWFRYDGIVRGVGQYEEREMSYSDVSAFFTKRALDWIRSHPGRFLKLTGKRALLFWGPAEISNNKAIGLEKENSRTLRHLPGFPFVLAIAFTGLLALLLHRRSGGRIPHRTSLALVGLFLGTYYVSFLPFLAAARFRVPLVPFLFLFGAYGIHRLAVAVRAADWSRAGALGACGAAVFLVASAPAGESRTDRAWWHTDRGVALARQGRQEEAMGEFRAALAANPGYVDAHEAAADLLVELGRPAEAMEHYRDVLRHRPKRYDLRMRLGELLLEDGRHEEAIREFREGLAIRSEVPEAHFELGRALVEAGRFQEGIDAFYESLGLQPGQPLAHLNIGIALAQLGRRDASLEEIDRALDLDPFSAEAHFQRGNLLLAAGSLREADRSFREALRIEPKYLEANVHLGNVYSRIGRYEEAVKWYEKALEIDTNHLTARYNLAGSLGNLGRIDEAIAVLEKALEVDPRHTPTRERLEALRAMKRAP